MKKKTQLDEIEDLAEYYVRMWQFDLISLDEAKDRFIRRCPNQEIVFDYILEARLVQVYLGRRNESEI